MNENAKMRTKAKNSTFSPSHQARLNTTQQDPKAQNQERLIGTQASGSLPITPMQQIRKL